jgi:hypothetical protein
MSTPASHTAVDGNLALESTVPMEGPVVRVKRAETAGGGTVNAGALDGVLTLASGLG